MCNNWLPALFTTIVLLSAGAGFNAEKQWTLFLCVEISFTSSSLFSREIGREGQFQVTEMWLVDYNGRYIHNQGLLDKCEDCFLFLYATLCGDSHRADAGLCFRISVCVRVCACVRE